MKGKKKRKVFLWSLVWNLKVWLTISLWKIEIIQYGPCITHIFKGTLLMASQGPILDLKIKVFFPKNVENISCLWISSLIFWKLFYTNMIKYISLCQIHVFLVKCVYFIHLFMAPLDLRRKENIGYNKVLEIQWIWKWDRSCLHSVCASVLILSGGGCLNLVVLTEQGESHPVPQI